MSNKDFEILRINNSDSGISIMLKDYSCCNLDNYNFMKKEVEQQFNLTICKDLFWFARLKVRTEGIGAGTFIMHKLVEILDERKISVFNCVNAYGERSFKDVIEFYRKFGFEVLNFGEGIMIRE